MKLKFIAYLPINDLAILYSRRRWKHMAIAALSSTGISQYVQSPSNLTSIQTTLQTLQHSLGFSNLSAAKTAFHQLQKLTDLNGGSSSASAQTTTDLSALGTALSKGDLTTARSAFATVQSDLAGVNSQAIGAAISAANETVQQIDALLGLGDSSTSSTDSLLGAGTSTTDLTTSLLSSVYGNHSPATGTKVNVTA